MRARTVTAVRVLISDNTSSVLELTSTDGTDTAVRRWEAPTATITHAARRLAEHYGLVGLADGYWVSSADELGLAPA
jgi:hypothetical protein